MGLLQVCLVDLGVEAFALAITFDLQMLVSSDLVCRGWNSSYPLRVVLYLNISAPALLPSSFSFNELTSDGT